MALKLTQNDPKWHKTTQNEQKQSKANQNEKQTGPKLTQNDQKQVKTCQYKEWIQSWPENPKRSETTQNDPKWVETS